MKLEHFGMAEPGDCRLVFTASAEELTAALAKEQDAPDAPQDEEELLTAAVNRTILEGFDPLYRQLVQEQQLVPVTDPDFELLAVNKAEGFRAGAQFYALPPLELGRDTGFVQPIEPHPLRRLTIELEINRNYGDEERAADAAGKAALRDRVTRELYAKRCAQAKDRAEKELVWQLGDEVTGPVPKRLEAGNYFAEQRQFNLSLQANGVNFDQFLAVRGQTVEQFRQWLHRQAERKLRSWLGLLLVAEREGLQPTEAEVNAALAHWNEKLDGERTFPANDTRKKRDLRMPHLGQKRSHDQERGSHAAHKLIRSFGLIHPGCIKSQDIVLSLDFDAQRLQYTANGHHIIEIRCIDNGCRCLWQKCRYNDRKNGILCAGNTDVSTQGMSTMNY